MVAHRDIKAFYDRVGSGEDWWSIFSDRAVDDLIRHGAFDSARAVCELGCGTGRLAARLLQDHLPPDCCYMGLDLSTTMVRLAQKRLRPWSDRAAVIQVDAAPLIPVADGVFDRFIATYVIELFEHYEALAVMREAHRILSKTGLACLTSLGQSQTPMSRLVCGLWNRIYRWRPTLVGGCRPIALERVLDTSDWSVIHLGVTGRWGIPCETVVAKRL